MGGGDKAVGIKQPASSSFSYRLSAPCFSGQRKPVSSYERITINKNSRATLSSLRHIIRKNRYRKDLRMVRGFTCGEVLGSRTISCRTTIFRPCFLEVAIVSSSAIVIFYIQYCPPQTYVRETRYTFILYF